MLTTLLAQAAQQVGTAPFDRPAVDWHALAPEIVVVAAAVVILLVDVVALEDGRRYMPTLCGLGLLGACIPIVTLAVDGSTRVMFGGAYVVDRTSLLLKVLLLLLRALAVSSAKRSGLDCRTASARSSTLTAGWLSLTPLPPAIAASSISRPKGSANRCACCTSNAMPSAAAAAAANAGSSAVLVGWLRQRLIRASHSAKHCRKTRLKTMLEAGGRMPCSVPC